MLVTAAAAAAVAAAAVATHPIHPAINVKVRFSY